MSYQQTEKPKGFLYHYTTRDHLEDILRDGRIRRMGDKECWFCTSLESQMEERKKNLCAMIPESLHKKVREEQEEWGIKLNEYMERILKDHFEKGEREMANGTRTLAFQVSEELFQRLKKYLKKTGQSQKEFVIGLIEDVLSQEEHVVSGEMQETEGKAELEETE